jgi:hypothetical protein
MARRAGGVVTPLGEPRTFQAAPLGQPTLPPADRTALLAFQRKTGRLQRAVMGAVRAAGEAQTRLDYLRKALLDTPAADPVLSVETRELEGQLKDLLISLTGDRTVASRNEPTPPSIMDRVQQVVGGHWSSTSAATRTHQRDYEIAASQFAPVLEKLRTLIEVDLASVEALAERAGAPWTPGRVPEWTPE